MFEYKVHVTQIGRNNTHRIYDDRQEINNLYYAITILLNNTWISLLKLNHIYLKAKDIGCFIPYKL